MPRRSGNSFRMRRKEPLRTSGGISICVSREGPYSRAPFSRMFFRLPELKIFSGSAHRVLAQRICDFIGMPLGDATVDSFPDGETFVKINENIRGRDVFIVQPTCP